jgi:tetratricopeptide (TPR) repeat protein
MRINSTHIKYTIILFVFLISLFNGFAENNAPDKKEKKNKSGQVSQPSYNSPVAVALLTDAKKESITGNTGKAEELFRQYIQKYPDGGAGYYELAKILADKKQADDAIKMASLAVEKDQNNIWYRVFLAESLQMNGDYKGAISQYKEINEKYPDKTDYFYQLAGLYLLTGRYKDAIETYNKIEVNTGISEDVSLQKEKIMLELKDISGADKELLKLVAAYPDNTRDLSILAEFYMTQNKFDQALQIYNKISETDPDNPYIHISLADYYRKTGNKEKAFEELKTGFANPGLDVDTKVNILLSYYTLNQIYSDLKEQAFELTKILIETHPNDPKAHSIYGDLLLQAKKYNDARDEFLKVISLDSSKYAVWEELLQLDLQLEKYQHLADYSQRTVELFPEQPVPYLFAGMAQYQLKNNDKALDLFKSGIKLVVNNDELLSQFYMYMGDTYHALKKTTESDNFYEKSLEVKDNNPYVLNNYSYYLSLRSKDLDKAERMAKKALSLDPENSSFQDTYGWILYKQGKFEEAKTWIGKALGDKKEINAEVLEHYGDVLFKLGETSQAYEYWVKARNKGQGSEFLEKKITDKKLYE